jgi:hypothetical protein
MEDTLAASRAYRMEHHTEGIRIRRWEDNQYEEDSLPGEDIRKASFRSMGEEVASNRDDVGLHGGLVLHAEHHVPHELHAPQSNHWGPRQQQEKRTDLGLGQQRDSGRMHRRQDFQKAPTIDCPVVVPVVVVLRMGITVDQTSY